MPRVAVPVDLPSLQAIITEEESGQYKGQIDFFNHCASKYNNLFSPAKPLSASIIYQRMRAGQIKTNVQSSRGRSLKGKVLTEEHKQKLVEGRKKASKEPKVINEKRAIKLRERFYDKPNLAKKVLDGSITAAVKLFCWGCCAGDRVSIRYCPCLECPLWDFRPFQISSVTNGDGPVEETDNNTDSDS